MAAFETTLTDAIAPEALLRRYAVERTLNDGSAVPENALFAYYQTIEAQQKGAEKITKTSLALPRVPRKIAKMLLDGLK